MGEGTIKLAGIGQVSVKLCAIAVNAIGVKKKKSWEGS